MGFSSEGREWRLISLRIVPGGWHRECLSEKLQKAGSYVEASGPCQVIWPGKISNR